MGRLGDGGFGMVYRARDELLGRELALKIPRVERCHDPRQVDEILAEARKVASLDHPGIVTIYEVGQLPEALPFVALHRVRNEAVRERLSQGVPFIAMKFVEGGSLDRRLAQRPFSPEEAARVVAQLSEAVAHAHQKGMVHRDLKLSNVLLDAQGVPKIIDFGLALEESYQLDLPQQAAGTLDYMSPEQLLGQAGWLDARCDIWALGVMLYELLTGKRPFRGTREQIRDQILYREAKPLRQTNPGIPSELEAICLKCLSKDIKGRYNTADDLAEALRGWWQRSQTSPAVEKREPIPPPTRVPPWLLVTAGLLVAWVGFMSRWPFREGGAPQERPEDAAAQAPIPSGQWVSLLERKPMEEVIDKSDPVGFWSWDSRTKVVKVGGKDFIGLSVGDIAAKSFRLRVRFLKNDQRGAVGLFWGGRIGNEDGMRSFRCHSIVLEDASSVDRAEWRLGRYKFHCFWKPGSPDPVWAPPERLRVKVVDLPSDFENELEITVVDGQMTTSRWNSQVLVLFQDGPHHSFPVEFSSTGIIGICNDRGMATFERVEIFI